MVYEDPSGTCNDSNLGFYRDFAPEMCLKVRGEVFDVVFDFQLAPPSQWVSPTEMEIQANLNRIGDIFLIVYTI